MRLDSIDCKKGQLFKKDHVLLQFTGLYDKRKDEIYEMDILMEGSEKFIVRWDDGRNGWALSPLKNQKVSEPLLQSAVEKTVRLWSFFEAENKTE